MYILLLQFCSEEIKEASETGFNCKDVGLAVQQLFLYVYMLLPEHCADPLYGDWVSWALFWAGLVSPGCSSEGKG